MYKKYGSKELKGFLKLIDKYLTKPADIIIIGGTAAALAYKITNRTQDIDTLNKIDKLKDAYEKALKESGLEISLEEVTVAETPYNYEDRLEVLDIGTKKLKIKVPEIHDLILMKMVRGYEHDIEAIKEMVEKNKVSKEILECRFKDEMGHVVGDLKLIEKKINYILEEVF